jgi:3-hydroxyisobutyrate dehydrogenase
MDISFIGLGIMGLPMAGHLLKAGHTLTINTRTKSKAEHLLNNGAKWANSPAEAANSDVIFICVTDTPDVEAVLLGKNGIASAAKPGTIIIDHSTISPGATKQFAEKLAAKGVPLLDAPVSGGDTGAKNATLSIMVGGDETAFAKVEPLLRHLGKTITHCGPSGAGQLTKLVNQVLVSVTNLAVCEALSFALRNDLDADKTITAISRGAAGSWQLTNLGPRMVKADFAPGFMIDLQQKDLRLVLEAAGESDTPLPATALVHQLFTSAQAAGRGRDGTQALFTVLHKLAGS